MQDQAVLQLMYMMHAAFASANVARVVYDCLPPASRFALACVGIQMIDFRQWVDIIRGGPTRTFACLARLLQAQSQAHYIHEWLKRSSHYSPKFGAQLKRSYCFLTAPLWLQELAHVFLLTSPKPEDFGPVRNANGTRVHGATLSFPVGSEAALISKEEFARGKETFPALFSSLTSEEVAHAWETPLWSMLAGDLQAAALHSPMDSSHMLVLRTLLTITLANATNVCGADPRLIHVRSTFDPRPIHARSTPDPRPIHARSTFDPRPIHARSTSDPRL